MQVGNYHSGPTTASQVKDHPHWTETSALLRGRFAKPPHRMRVGMNSMYIVVMTIHEDYLFLHLKLGGSDSGRKLNPPCCPKLNEPNTNIRGD